MALKIVTALNKLPPPARSVSDTVSATKRKAEFDKLIKELKRLEPGITKGEELKKQAVASINIYLDERPRGDRDKNLILIAGALGKNVRTLYRWISEEADPESAEKRLEERRKTPKVTQEPIQPFVEALNDYLRKSSNDIESLFDALKDAAIPTEKMCAALKGLCQ